MPTNPVIQIVNQSTVPVEQWLPSGKTLNDVSGALTTQASRDFAPFWSESALVVAPPSVPPVGDPSGQVWTLYILDNADQAGALGYHDIDANGNPILKVFVKDTLAAGDKVTVDMSHEILETLADPYCNLCATSAKGRVYAYEVADAVEDTTYEIDGITVSNFVTPQFFEDVSRAAGAAAVQLDYLKQVTVPLQLLSGGYLSFFHVGKWHQEFGSEQAKERHARRGTKPRMTKRAKFASHHADA